MTAKAMALANKGSITQKSKSIPFIRREKALICFFDR